MDIPIDTLLFKEPVTAGMDIYVIAELTRFYRGCNEHTTPITVRPEPNGTWRILDGRHRVVASMMAGRKHIRAHEEPDPKEPTP